MEIADYIRAFGRHKFAAFAIPLCGIVAAVAMALMLPPEYRAEATLHVTPPRSIAKQEMSPVESYINTYRGVATSPSFMQDVLDEFDLDSPPRGLTWYQLRERIRASMVLRNGRLFEITVKLSDPRLARDVTNYLAERLLQFAADQTQRQRQRARQSVDPMVQDATKERDQAATTLTDFRKESELRVLKQRISTLLTRKGTMESRLADLLTQMQDLQAQRKELQQALADQERTVKVSRLLADRPAVHQFLAQLSETDSSKMATLPLQVETLNPLYTGLQEQFTNVKVQLVGLQQRQKALQEELVETKNELSRLQPEVATDEMRLQTRQADYNHKQSIQRALDRDLKMENAAIAAMSPTLTLVSPALQPPPISRLSLLAAIVAVSIMAAVGYIISVEYMRIELSRSESRDAEKTDREPGPEDPEAKQ